MPLPPPVGQPLRCFGTSNPSWNLGLFPSPAFEMEASLSTVQCSSGTSWFLSTPLFQAWNGGASSLLRWLELTSWLPSWLVVSLGLSLQWTFLLFALCEPLKWVNWQLGFWVSACFSRKQGKVRAFDA